MANIIDKDACKVRLLDRFSEGLNPTHACRLCGVSYGTYISMRKKDKVWASRVDSIRSEYKSERIEVLLEKLAEGHDQIEESSTWTEENELGEKILKTRKVKKLPPNDRAIMMLAKKYAKEYTSTEINVNHEIGITIKDRALTVEERMRILQDDKEEGQAIDIIEYTEV